MSFICTLCPSSNEIYTEDRDVDENTNQNSFEAVLPDSDQNKIKFDVGEKLRSVSHLKTNAIRLVMSKSLFLNLLGRGDSLLYNWS
jgi:hypothetical protein